MPAMPEGAVDGVVRGMYRYRTAEVGDGVDRQAHLFGSGAIMAEVLAAADLLEARGIPTHVWSVTSYAELRRDGLATERRNRLHPSAARERTWVEEQLDGERGVFVSASDYLCALGEGISRWIPGPYVVLGTDGYGLSEDRGVLRDHFEVSAAWIAHGALAALERAGELEQGAADAAADEWGLDRTRVDPAIA